MSPAAASTKDCQQFLNQTRVPDLPEVYLLGCLERRVTVYSQQVRALNLIYALEQCDVLQRGARIGIVGAGIAGLTAAAAALQRGFAVTLLEEKPSTVLLWRQTDCDKRWLHPHIYDWPQQDSLQDDAKLPVMTWTAGTASRVVGSLTAQWQALVKSCQPGRLELNRGVTDVTVINRDGKPQLQWGPGQKRKDCAAVILAVGFGDEQTVAPLKPHSYWADDDLASADTSSSRRCLISGSGDGGLTDVLRASIAGFQHHTFVKELGLDQSTNPAAQKLVELLKQIEASVERCALDADGEAQAARLLTERYLSDEMSECAAFIDETLKTRPTGRVVTLNHTGVDVLTRKASALNRLLVSRLIHLGVVTPWPGKLEAGAIQHQPGSHYKVTINGKSKDFNKVIIRQGVASALEKLNPSWAQKCKATLGPLSILDLTRTRLWSDGWLRDESGSTPPAAGGGSGGGAGSVLPTTPAATHAAQFPAAELQRGKAETEQYMREQVSGRAAKPISLAAPSMIALGPEVIALGRVLRTRGTQWTLQLDEFIVGEIATLRLFGDSFFNIPESERFFYCEAERIGRLITEPPSFISVSGLHVELSVAAPLPRAQSLHQYHVDRLGPECALDLSSDEPALDLSGREIEGGELVPQILNFHLSTCKGGWGYGAYAGSRIGELFHRFSGERLESFITMEIIRLATVPCITEGPPEPIPFGFIERVRDVRVLSLPTEASDILKARLTLDIFGMEPNQEFVIPISTSIVTLGPKPRLQFLGLDSLEVS